MAAKKKTPKVKTAPYGSTPKLNFGRKVRKEVPAERFKQLEEAVLAAWKHDFQSARDFGRRLLDLREAFYVRGDFTKWLRRHSIEQNRASYCMRVALNLPKKAQERQKELPQNKLKKHLNEIFAPAAEKLPDNVSKQLVALIMDCCDKLAATAGWTIKADVKGNKGVTTQLSAKLQVAINEVLDSVFVWEQYHETGNDVVMRVPPAGKKAQEKRMAAAASAGGPPNAPSSTTPPPLARQTK
jgi:hypothetical protein